MRFSYAVSCGLFLDPHRCHTIVSFIALQSLFRHFLGKALAKNKTPVFTGVWVTWSVKFTVETQELLLRYHGLADIRGKSISCDLLRPQCHAKRP